MNRIFSKFHLSVRPSLELIQRRYKFASPHHSPFTGQVLFHYLHFSTLINSAIFKMGVSSRLIPLLALVAPCLAAPAPAPVAMPNFNLQGGNFSASNLMRRAEAVNFNQDYVASGANVQYSPNQGAGSFSVNYNTNADFVVGLGWQPGDSK